MTLKHQNHPNITHLQKDIGKKRVQTKLFFWQGANQPVGINGELSI